MNQLDYGARIYDVRAGRFLSRDPLQADYPWFTPYQYAGDSPIGNIDLDGLENYNDNLVHAKNSEENPVLAISFESKEDFDLVDVFAYANKYNTSEIHNLHYNGKLIAQFTSFQDLKTVVHGRTPQQINKIGLQQEGEAVDRIIYLSQYAKSLRQPPAQNYGRSPTENQNLLRDAAKFTPSSQAEKQIIRAQSGNPNAVAKKAASSPTIQQKRATSIQSQSLVRSRLESQLGPDEILIEQPRFYIGDGTNKKLFAVPDFAIYNTKTNQFVKIPDAKNGGGNLTGNQKLLNEQGGTFKGSSRYPQAKPQSIRPGLVTTEKTNLPYN